MKEKPIIFSPEMVRAILAKQKTQTRRVIKPQIQQMEEGFAWWHKSLPAGHCHSDLESVIQLALKSCPYGKVGDRLWVREAFYPDPPDTGDWCYYEFEDGTPNQMNMKAIPAKYQKPEHVMYKASSSSSLQWKPSMFMPRWASRITLEVTNLRVERIQSISTEDCIAEGFSSRLREFDAQVDLWQQVEAAWNKMHDKKGFGWNQNPFVWVVGFKVVK